MLKKDLVKAAAKGSGHSEKTAREVIEAIERAVLHAVAAGRSVMLMGLGKITTSSRGPKKARHMVSGESVIVPAHRVALLRPSFSLKAAANGKTA